MIPVYTAVARYRAGVAELPLSTARADSPVGAVVVLPGAAGWIDEVRAAVAAGARGVIVTDPAIAPAGDVRALAASVGVPVIIERPLLRADVAADAFSEGTPAIVVVDGAATPGSLDALARDAVGWARTLLAGTQPDGALTVVEAGDGLALLQTDAGVGATVAVVATDRPGTGWLRATALGDPLVEVEVEGARARVTHSTSTGRRVAPERYEASARVALRRILAAVAGDPAPVDLALLADDTAISGAMLAAGRSDARA